MLSIIIFVYRDYYLKGYWPNVQGAYFSGIKSKQLSKIKHKKAVVRRHTINDLCVTQKLNFAGKDESDQNCEQDEA